MEYNIILYASFQSSSSQRVIIALEMKKLRYTIASPANMSREEYIKLTEGKNALWRIKLK